MKDPPSISVVVLEYTPRGFGDDAVRSVERAAEGFEGAPEILLLTRDPNRACRGASVRALAPGGTGAWLEAAVHNTSGEVLSFLDDDDVFLPGKLATVQRLFGDPSVGYFHNSFRTSRPPEEDGSYRAVAAREPQRDNSTRRLADVDKDRSTSSGWWDDGAAFNSSSISVRRSLVEPYPPGSRGLRNALGTFLFCRALASPLALLAGGPELTGYRTHPSNRSGSGTEGARERWRQWRALSPDVAADALTLATLLDEWRPEIHAAGPLRAVWARNALLASAGSAIPFRTLLPILRDLGRPVGGGAWGPRLPYLLLGTMQLASPAVARGLIDYLAGATPSGSSAGT
jgi:hypothetical protein